MSVAGITGIIAEIRTEIGACRLCPAMRPFRRQAPDAFGTTSTGYMLVGEAPGLGAQPFDDAAGKVMREALTRVGDDEFRDLEDLFFLAHATRCIPPHPKEKEKTRAPTRAECRTCRPYLSFEMRALRPRLIITFGANAAESVLGQAVKMEQVHAQRHHVKDIEILTLLAPSPYNRASLKRLDMTIEKYTRWLTGLFGALIDEYRK